MENDYKSLKKKVFMGKNDCISLTCLSFLLGLFLSTAFPLRTLTISGNIVFLDKNGNKVEQRRAAIQCFSKYPINLLRSGNKRWFRTYHSSEIPYFQILIPNYPATVFIADTEGKYATVIDIDPKKPQTELVVELRPRYTITGKFIRDTTGKPLVNQKFHLDCSTVSKMGRPFPFMNEEGEGAIFHESKSQTDSDGNFSADGMIPGAKYHLYINNQRVKVIRVPFLKPEEYEQPFSLGDILVPNSATTEGMEDFS